jgi:hypothetical protein
MKKKSTSQSAFFNVRVLFGLFVALAGVSLALAGFGAFSVQAQQKQRQKYTVTTQPSRDPLVPVMFDCSKIHELGIDKQENFRAGAIMIFCGLSEGGKPSASHGRAFSRLVKNLTAPLVYGSTDVDLINNPSPETTFPDVTQSETFTTANPDNPDQIVVAFNDSRGRFANPINISGASVSNDGGLTFTRLTKANEQSPFDNTFGDPVVIYHKPSGTWVTAWLDAACGGQGIGGYRSTTPDDPNSWTHYCAHNSGADDRESGFADNNPSSPFFGRLYISWNDFGIGGTLSATFSTDGGATWHSPVTVFNGGVFMRDVQITGDLAGSGAVYIAGMDEGGGGFPHNDTNYIFKSTDGGNTWTNTYGPGSPSFPGPGIQACSEQGYFSCMFSDNGGYWRHEGWGQPAAINNFVHLVYAQQGTGGDHGDVYYIRSTDGGFTFSAPLKLNTDATTRPQWQPNLSVSPIGSLLATWYDARDSASCTEGNPAVPCYRMYSRKSNDNGATWLPDDTLSDVVSPLPGQPDGGIFGDYAGDYDYGSAILTKHFTSWVDGRVTINSQSQQDAFTDSELAGLSVTSTDPACNSVVFTQPTDFTVNVSLAVDPNTLQPSDFTCNGIAADSVDYTPGETTMIFHFNNTPVTNQGEQTMHVPAGAFISASDGLPVQEFQCTFRYDVTLLAVTNTDPPVGGTFTPPAPGTYNYDVNWNEAVDENSVQDSDLQLSGNTGAFVTGHSFMNGDTTIRFTLNITFGGPLTAHIAAGAITDTFGNPNADFSGNYTVEGCPPGQYTITPGADTIVPGTTDIGNHCDDCDTAVSLPFPFQLYEQTFTSVNVSSNGRLDFVVPNEPGGNITSCLPAPPNVGPYDYTIFGAWQNVRTVLGLSGCSNFPNNTCGIFTSITGSAPDRIFNIEWRALVVGNNASAVNFEVRLYENPNENLRFDVVYGNINTNGASQQWVGGVQGNSAASFFTQDFCGATPPHNVSRTYEIPPCSPTPTPTPTVSPTATPSATPTATPTGTPIRVTPTPRPRPTPHPRP